MGFLGEFGWKTQGLSIPDRRPSPLLATSKCSTGVVRQSSPTFAQRTGSPLLATVRSANSTVTATFLLIV
ncbi:hypothetical protein L195_g060502 [Trifolium pratense]|uniref:Uncharacterized protein n=1 Tax=Trifolium pratense TaxID=57577 RepID=A0A2K3K494_TRIPR|nr:hypothetical protein L195_g060502 [Trifolium pratense]